MKKLAALRQHLLDAVPDLAKNPDKMLTFIQDGRIKFFRGAHLSHEYIVEAQIIVTDYTGDLDTLIIPLLQWLSRYEPNTEPDKTVALEAEILDNQTYDIAMSVQLSERVVATVDCDAGQINVEHRMPKYEIETCPATHWTLYIKKDGDLNHKKVADWDSST